MSHSAHVHTTYLKHKRILAIVGVAIFNYIVAIITILRYQFCFYLLISIFTTSTTTNDTTRNF